jgi:hypothetical protein
VQAPAATGSWTFTLPVNAGTNGFVLTTDGAGLTSWQPGGGSGTLIVNSTPITGGAANRLLADNGGALVEVVGANNSVLVSGSAGALSMSTALPNGVTGTTQSNGDNSTRLATDQFVQSALVGAGLVTSVFGRAGAVVAQSGDYTFAQIGSTPTTVAGYGITNALVTTNNLSDLTSFATARSNLGLGTFATQNFLTPPPIGVGGTPNSAAFTSVSIITGLTIVGGATLTYNGNLIGLPPVASNLAFQVGSFVPGDCIQVAAGPNGIAGGVADSGSACGSGGGGGGSTWHNQTFVANVNYTPGAACSPITNCQLTLSSLPASQAVLEIFEDGVAQPAPSAWTVNLSTGVVTFANPILAQNTVYATWGTASLSTGTVTSVSVTSVNGFAGVVATYQTTPAISIQTTITGILQGNGTAISAATLNGSGNLVATTGASLVTPALGVATATSLAIGGATIGSNALAVTGTTALANTTIGVGSAITSSGAGGALGTGAFAAAGITALTSDVTASGPGSAAATIAANAVTYAKFQQVAASSLVGNPTGSPANAEGITLGVTLAFSSTTLNCVTATAVTGTGLVGCSKPDGTSIAIDGSGVLSVIGSPATAIVVGGGATTVTNGTPGDCLYVAAGPVLGQQSCGVATSVAINSTTVTGSTTAYLLTTDSSHVLQNEAVSSLSFAATQITSANLAFARESKYVQAASTLAVLALGGI